MAYEYSNALSMFVGASGIASAATFALDSAFTYETGGDALVAAFIAPVGQTNAALKIYAYLTAITGSPSDVRAAIWASATSGDPDRPQAGASALATSAVVDLTGASAGWVTFTIASVSLTQGVSYLIIIDNRTGTPASNYPTFGTRYGIGFAGVSSVHSLGHTADGITTDPTQYADSAALVLAFSDGTVLGNPYPTYANHASNADTRGNRVSFSEDLVISGAWWYGGSAFTNFKIYATDGTELLSQAIGFREANRIGGVRFAPYTLTGGTEYDCMLTVSGATTNGYIGNTGAGTVPADVTACIPSWIKGHVSGTPGSLTPDTAKFMMMGFFIDNNPAIAGTSTVAFFQRPAAQLRM